MRWPLEFAPKKELDNYRFELFKKSLDLYSFDDTKLIFKAPELCKEESAIPGYISVTNRYDDEICQINTKYIVSLAPCCFERYDGPVCGTKIELANIAGNEVKTSIIDVYEPVKMIEEKINAALESLSKSVGGLTGLLEKIEILATASPRVKNF